MALSITKRLSAQLGRGAQVAAVPTRPTPRRRCSRHQSHLNQQFRLQGLIPSAQQNYGDAYDNLFKSSVFQSELVVREFDSIMGELRQLSMMAARFPDFDLTGKEMFLDKMEEGCDRFKVFMKRLELCDDKNAKEYLRYVNAQMMEGGFTMQQMFQGLQGSIGQYRYWVEEEKKISSDPIRHQAFLASFKQQWGQTAMGAIDMSVLAQMADPMMVAQAQKHPEFYRCLKEISDNPGNSQVMSKWLDHPVLGKLVAAMWKTMQVQHSKQQEQQQQQQQPQQWQQYDQQWEEEQRRRRQQQQPGDEGSSGSSK